MLISVNTDIMNFIELPAIFARQALVPRKAFLITPLLSAALGREGNDYMSVVLFKAGIPMPD